MPATIVRPDVFNYLDFRAYLKDFLKYMRMRNPAFRFQTLVEKFGLNSRSHYIDTMKGRRLTDKFIDSYLRICELEGKDADFFRAIVGYEQARTESEKTGYFNSIVALSPNLETVKLEQETYRYFSKWYHPVMLSLLDVHRQENDHRKLAKYIKPPISAVQAKRAIRLLEELSFISWDAAAGQWISYHKFFKCTDGAQAVALREFHRKMMEAGRNAYDRDYDGQNFSTLTLSASFETRRKIERLIVDFRKTLMDTIKEDSRSEVVIQINLQLFELSKLIRKKNARGATGL
jgi:uncharacterized protein (TIGR02147 family)